MRASLSVHQMNTRKTQRVCTYKYNNVMAANGIALQRTKTMSHTHRHLLTAFGTRNEWNGRANNVRCSMFGACF